VQGRGYARRQGYPHSTCGALASRWPVHLGVQLASVKRGRCKRCVDVLVANPDILLNGSFWFSSSKTSSLGDSFVRLPGTFCPPPCETPHRRAAKRPRRWRLHLAGMLQRPRASSRCSAPCRLSSVHETSAGRPARIATSLPSRSNMGVGVLDYVISNQSKPKKWDGLNEPSHSCNVRPNLDPGPTSSCSE